MLPYRTPSLARAAGLACAVLLSACQAQPGVPADEAALLERIRAEIGEARCSSDAQCRTVAVGHKACGGPQQWWAWSTATSRADRLQAWSAELADLQRKRQEAAGMASDCRYIADPGAVCQAERCLLRVRSPST